MLGTSHTLCDWQSSAGKMDVQTVNERPSLLHNLGKMLSCPICLQLFKTAANLPCGHTFCAGCLGESLMLSSICPVCHIHATAEDTRLAPHVDVMVRTYAQVQDTTGMQSRIQPHRLLEAPKVADEQNGDGREEANPQWSPVMRAGCKSPPVHPSKMSRAVGAVVSPKKRPQKPVDEDDNVPAGGALLLSSPSKRDRWPANLAVKRVDHVAVEGLQSDSGGEEVVIGDISSDQVDKQCFVASRMTPLAKRIPGGAAEQDQMAWPESRVPGVEVHSGGGKFKAPGVGQQQQQGAASRAMLPPSDYLGSPAMSTGEGVSAAGISGRGGDHCRSPPGNTMTSGGERGRPAGAKSMSPAGISPPCRDGSFKPFFWASDATNASEDGAAQPAPSQGLTAGKPITFSDLLAPEGSEEVGDFATTGVRTVYSPGKQRAQPSAEPKSRICTSPSMMEAMAVGVDQPVLQACGNAGETGTSNAKVYLKRKGRDTQTDMISEEPPAKKKFDLTQFVDGDDEHQRDTEWANRRWSTGSASGSGGEGEKCRAEEIDKGRNGGDSGGDRVGNHGNIGSSMGVSGMSKRTQDVPSEGNEGGRNAAQGRAEGRFLGGKDGAVVPFTGGGGSGDQQVAVTGVSSGMCQNLGPSVGKSSPDSVKNRFGGVHISEHVALVQRLVGCVDPMISDRQQQGTGEDSRKAMELPVQAHCEIGTAEPKGKPSAECLKDEHMTDGRVEDSDEDTSEEDDDESDSSEDDETPSGDGTHGCAFCGQIGRSAMSQRTTMAPNVYYAKGKLCNVEAELNRGRRVKCSVCSKPGAVLGCYRPRCTKSYHYECAKSMNGTRFDDENYVMLCPDHMKSSFPWESKKKKKEPSTPKGKGKNARDIDSERPKKVQSHGKNGNAADRVNNSGAAERLTVENTVHASGGASAAAPVSLATVAALPIFGAAITARGVSNAAAGEEESKRRHDDSSKKPLPVDGNGRGVEVPMTLAKPPAENNSQNIGNITKENGKEKKNDKQMPQATEATAEAGGQMVRNAGDRGENGNGANLEPCGQWAGPTGNHQPEASREERPAHHDEAITGSVSMNISGFTGITGITGMTAITMTRNDSVAAQVIGCGGNTCSEGSQSVGRAQHQVESNKTTGQVAATGDGENGSWKSGSDPQQEKEASMKAARLDKQPGAKKKGSGRKKRAQTDGSGDESGDSSSEEEEAEVGDDEDYQSCSNGVDGEELAENEERNYACAFCRQKGRSAVAGGLIFCSIPGNHQGSFSSNPSASRTGAGAYVHRECATWAPNVFYKHDKLCNVDAEIQRGRKIRCAVCLKPGAVLGCFRKKCPKSYHFTCAVNCKGTRFDEDQYVMLCPEHSQSNFPGESKNKKKGGLSKGSQEDTYDAIEEESGNKKKGAVQKGTPHKADRADHSRKDVIVGTSTAMASSSALAKASRVVICGSGLTSGEKDLLDSVASMSGFAQEKQWSQSVTHVIASVNSNRCAKRTLKFLFSVLYGQWVITPEWLIACRKAGRPVAEEPFEVIGDAHGAYDGPNQGRIRQLSKAPPLLGGLRFYLCGEFGLPSKSDILRIVTAGGGTVLPQTPEACVKLTADGGKSAESIQPTLIILYNGSTPPMPRQSQQSNVDAAKLSAEELQACPPLQRWKEAQALASAAGSDAVAVSHMWLLDTAALCKLRETTLYTAPPSLS
ncbi:hypothetical protein CBR_g39265 [Chara braunii]|uniref:RING-type E3 ubiquitin transferase BRCA1 n=1 Tax=Chara braunii TaxID=69332 RepID=A0A388K182_CHABU|nr:hypothetical protein CBR_g39265 [Chara braunii]|eukprot:GBG63723.1 hypothetical protein CBR_g39265 [Chara braunii]